MSGQCWRSLLEYNDHEPERPAIMDTRKPVFDAVGNMPLIHLR